MEQPERGKTEQEEGARVRSTTDGRGTTRAFGSKYLGNIRRGLRELTCGFDVQGTFPWACQVLGQ